MMTRLLSSLGAFGASYALFSYFGGGALPYAICAALLAPLLSFAFSRLSGKRRLPLLALLALLLLSLPLLERETFLSSLLSALIPLVDTLKEPYDIDMAAPLAKAIASPALAKGWLTCLLALFFTAGAWSKAARAMAALLSFFLILFGFYFGVNPPALAILCCASYGLSVFASLKNHGLGMPEIPTLALTLLLGAGLLLVFPESRYEQPAIFSHMQEKIIGWTDPYDPIFHAGNAYTGMMRAPPDISASAAVPASAIPAASSQTSKRQAINTSTSEAGPAASTKTAAGRTSRTAPTMGQKPSSPRTKANGTTRGHGSWRPQPEIHRSHRSS